jgi:4-hydroxy-3-methylbut-2-en-1-yl diphosphate reductase
MKALMSKESVKSRSEVEWKFASVMGMDAETRQALETLECLAAQGPVAVPGEFMPDAGVREKLRRLGVIEEAREDDFPRVKSVALPFGGGAMRDKRRWQEAGWKVLDTRSQAVRRAHVALGLLRMEGAQTLIIGRHDDAESQALAADYPGTIVLEDTTDIARMRYAPAFGAVCQTTLSPRRVTWLSQQLRLRYRDAKLTFLDTVSPAMVVRERALESLCGWCDGVVVAGDRGEASVEALLETAKRFGKPAALLDELAELEGCRRLAVTAGGFVLGETLEGLARAISGRFLGNE